VKAEGIHRGAGHVRQTAILGDGAAWIWAIATDSSLRPPGSSTCSTPASTCTTWAASWSSCWATARTNGSPPAWKTWITATSTASAPPPASPPCRHQEDRTRHRARLLRAQCPPACATSGSAPAACSSATPGRVRLQGSNRPALKLSGMRWTITGAQAITTLRCQQARRPHLAATPLPDRHRLTGISTGPYPVTSRSLVSHLQNCRAPRIVGSAIAGFTPVVGGSRRRPQPY